MLKSSKYIYEKDLYKIKNPTNIMIREIQEELSKYSTDSLEDIDFDNPKLNLWLLQYLVGRKSDISGSGIPARM